MEMNPIKPKYAGTKFDFTVDEGNEWLNPSRENDSAIQKARAGLRHTVVCPNVTGGTKNRIAHSKRARADSLAIVDQPQVARTCSFSISEMHTQSCGRKG